MVRNNRRLAPILNSNEVRSGRPLQRPIQQVRSDLDWKRLGVMERTVMGPVTALANRQMMTRRTVVKVPRNQCSRNQN